MVPTYGCCMLSCAMKSATPIYETCMNQAMQSLLFRPIVSSDVADEKKNNAYTWRWSMKPVKYLSIKLFLTWRTKLRKESDYIQWDQSVRKNLFAWCFFAFLKFMWQFIEPFDGRGTCCRGNNESTKCSNRLEIISKSHTHRQKNNKEKNKWTKYSRDK